MIRISSPSSHERPQTNAIEVTDAGWQLDPERYGDFVETVTGIPLGDDLSAADCYRIRNRIEAKVDAKRRRGEWTPTVAEEYPDVESRDDILAVARFFRECHDHYRDAAGDGGPISQ
ncbi:hypothetical protein [Haloarchaeobius sp. DFWS5]|uniref:hypothetical protein n=1 Tax=Haloarchaeobius sp. DFWS5 TaxID=3446114 RepID=UPI003EBC0DF2